MQVIRKKERRRESDPLRSLRSKNIRDDQDPTESAHNTSCYNRREEQSYGRLERSWRQISRRVDYRLSKHSGQTSSMYL